MCVSQELYPGVERALNILNIPGYSWVFKTERPFSHLLRIIINRLINRQETTISAQKQSFMTLATVRITVRNGEFRRPCALGW